MYDNLKMAYHTSFINDELCVVDTVSGRKWKGFPLVLPIQPLENDVVKSIIEKLSVNANIIQDNKLLVDGLEITIDGSGIEFKIMVFNPCSIQVLEKSIVIKVPEVLQTDFEKTEFLIKKNTVLIQNDIAELKNMIRLQM